MKTNQRNYQEKQLWEEEKMSLNKKSFLTGSLVALALIIFLIMGLALGYLYWSNGNLTNIKEAIANKLALPDLNNSETQDENNQPAETIDTSTTEDETDDDVEETVCPVCEGEGTVDCPTCAGDGRDDCDQCENGLITEIVNEEVHEDDDPGDGVFYDGGSEAIVFECEECDGHGYFDCDDCEGTGQQECANCGGDGAV